MDIRKAETLSSDFYLDPLFFEESKEKIFGRSWQLLPIGNLEANLNSCFLLEGFLDEPILLSRHGDNILCLSNTCTHRGALLIEGACEASGIRCRYHGRRFDLAGKFVSMPEFDGVVGFPSEADNLRNIPSASWKGLIFASLSPIAPIEEFLDCMESRTAFESPLRFAGRKDYFLNAHWALYCENYLEGFHIPFVHPGLNKEIGYGSYSTELFRYSSLQVAHGPMEEVAAHYFFVFPNMMFNFYPWGLSVNLVAPIAPNRTMVTYLTYISDETKLGKGAGGDLETVEIEDQQIVESVQKGIRSRFYRRGRYSSAKEQGTHHFHRLIEEFMTD